MPLPEAARNLVTTHDGYRYLASTYGLNIAGFVSASASGEPSIQQRQRLRRTVEDLKVPAIYLDKSTAMRSPDSHGVGSGRLRCVPGCSILDTLMRRLLTTRR